MAEFRPFNYAQAVQSGQQVAMNALKLREGVRDVQGRNILSDLSAQGLTGFQKYNALQQAGRGDLVHVEQDRDLKVNELKSNYAKSQLERVGSYKSFMNMAYKLEEEGVATTQQSMDKFGVTEKPESYEKVAKPAIDTFLGRTPIIGKEKFGAFEKIEGTEFWGQIGLDTGKYANQKKGGEDGPTVGTSEFERHLAHSLRVGDITQERYNELVEQRAEGFAGEMTKKDITKFGEQVRKTGVAESSALRGEYQEGVEHFAEIDTNINEAIVAMDSGNTGLSDVMLNRVLAQVQDDKIRAYAAMQQFDKPFGNLANRVAETIERFITGKRSDEEKAEIRSTLEYFQSAYAQPKRKVMRDRYRAMSVESGHDPFSVVPPESPEDVRDSTLIDKKRKREILMLHFPEMFK